MATFEQTRNIMSIINSENISFDIILNQNTGKRFGKDSNGRTYRLSDKVKELTPDLSVSWFTPEVGEPSWMIHPPGQIESTVERNETVCANKTFVNMVCDLSKNNLKENLENYVNLLIEGQLLNEEQFNYKDIINTIQKKVAAAKNDVQQSLGIAYHVPQIIFDTIRNNPEFSENDLVEKGYDPTQLIKDINTLKKAEDKMAAIAALLGIENTSIEETEIIFSQNHENKKAANASINYLFFDTETNGKALNFNAPVKDLKNWPRITQLGWQLYDDKQNLISEGCHLIKPDGWIIPLEDFFIINNMSTERCEKEGKPLVEILNLFLKDVSKADFLIAHNMKFDINVLGAELLRCNLKFPKELKNICTMIESTNYCQIPGVYNDYKWPTLTELYVKLFGTDFHGAHDALDDVKACSKSFFELQKIGILNTTIIENEFSIIEESSSLLKNKIKLIESAIKNNQRIKFTYQSSFVFNSGEITTRKIKPYYIEKIGITESFCVNGFCYLRNSERVFAIERISQLEVIN